MTFHSLYFLAVSFGSSSSWLIMARSCSLHWPRRKQEEKGHQWGHAYLNFGESTSSALSQRHGPICRSTTEVVLPINILISQHDLGLTQYLFAHGSHHEKLYIFTPKLVKEPDSLSSRLVCPDPSITSHLRWPHLSVSPGAGTPWSLVSCTHGFFPNHPDVTK